MSESMHEPQKEAPRLMRAFAEHGDKSAFHRLVELYIPVVFGAALRRCDGNRMLAEEVTQDVFTKFARRMHRLRADERIGAWLHRAATFRAGDVMRAEKRRRARERTAAAMLELDQLPETDAWEALSPIVDDAMARLRADDREALVLRFLEGRKSKNLADALGVSESAARKRVERALVRLRAKLRARDVVVGAVLLGATLGSRTASAGISVPSSFSAVVATKAVEQVAGSTIAAASFLRYAGLGALGTFAVGSFPLIASLRSEEESTKSESQSEAAVHMVAESKAPTEIVASISPKKPPETVDEIVAALGELLSRPLSELDKSRCRLLFEKIRDEQSGEALRLMDAMWNETIIARLEHFGSGLGSKREDLCWEWGKLEPAVALEWAMKVMSNRLRVAPPFNPWGRTIERTLQHWVRRDFDAALDWARKTISAGALQLTNNEEIAENFADALLDEVYKKHGVKASLDLMIELEETKNEPEYLFAFSSATHDFRTTEDFHYAMKLIERELPSPLEKRKVHGAVLQSWRRVDWQDGKAWLDQLPANQRHYSLAWRLGFPPKMDDSFDARGHADWLRSISPHPSRMHTTDPISRLVQGWFPHRPKEATDWMLANGLVGKTTVFYVLSVLKRAEADTEDFRSNAVRLLLETKRRFPENFEKRLKLNPGSEELMKELGVLP